MEKRADLPQEYPLLSLSPFVFYPFLILALFLLILLISSLLIKREAKTSSGFLQLLGINAPKDLLFLILLILFAIFVLMVLILSLGFLPAPPPLPA